MCGYCVEGGFTIDFIECEKSYKKVELNNILVTTCLQESENIPEIICELKKFDNFHGSIEIVFCRIWEMLLFQEDYEYSLSLLSEFETASINDFFIKLKGNNDHKLCESLSNNNLYTDRSNWKNFIKNKPQLIEDSTNVLNDYYHFWILGKGKKTSDPSKRIQETGIMNPIENTIPKDMGKFYSLFPIVYFSLLVLLRYQKDSNIIKLIALENPYDVPDFLGYDLWLQRKAFSTCTKNYGVQFILDNYDNIRIELIYYSLLKESVCLADMEVLKDHLLSDQHWGESMWVDSDSIVELINSSMSAS